MRHVLLAAASSAALMIAAMGPAPAADKHAPLAVDILPPAAALAPSCYVQALVGSSIDSVKVKEADVLPTAISATGWTIGAGVGCDVKIERIVVGALARIELPVATDGSVIKADQSWMAGFRAGYMLNTGLMVYGLVGYTQADWKIDFEKMSRDGMVLGGGLEVMLSKHLSLTAEYTQTGLGSLSDGMTKLEPVNHSARLGLNYRFNSLFGGE